VKKILTILLLFLPIIGFNQQGKNIDLKEVVNTAAVIPKIEIDNFLYAMRDRDEIMAELLRSTFWLKSFKFSLNLEDYETGKKYTYENEGQVRIFINDNELTQRHLFKTYKAINNLLDNSEKIQIISSSETLKNVKPLTTQLDVGEFIYKTTTEVRPVTLIKIKSDLPIDTEYNRKNKLKRIKTLADFEVKIKKEQSLSPISYNEETTKTIQLDNIEVVQNINDGGVIYSPQLINGEIVFKKNSKLTRLNQKKERFIRMGLNEYGIDLNATTWSQALRGYLRGKQTATTSDGLPILYGVVTLGPEQPGPLWVIDGVRTSRPPSSVRTIADQIREVNILKYSKASKYGSQGVAGVIEVNTALSLNSLGSYKRSFEVRGKKNIELMEEFKIFEKQFMSKRDKLNDKRKIFIETNDVERLDSIQKLLDVLQYKSYLYTANFAINNSDSEIAPYLGVKKIADAKIEILETIEEKLTEKVKKSRYGKIFLELVENRREKDSTTNN
tara:strand:- start:553 stop:2052 length:1500 start_codon:yes stop_codon:yes gene_type:complete